MHPVPATITGDSSGVAQSSDSPTMTRDVRAEGTALITFEHAREQNPFSIARMRELETHLLDLDHVDHVRCVILYGGNSRSFAVGGDFHEVANFEGGDEVDEWIDAITDLYKTVAGIRKPVVAALDGYAIGIGLQIALCCDYRIGSGSCELIMPEFKLGIACNFGGFLLERVVGRALMQQMLFSCEPWPASRALASGLIHDVATDKDLLRHAEAVARRIASYTAQAVQSTRPRVNAELVAGLEGIRSQAKASHRVAFAVGEAQKRMRRILHEDAGPAGEPGT